jgi:hypothetical protein
MRLGFRLRQRKRWIDHIWGYRAEVRIDGRVQGRTSKCKERCDAMALSWWNSVTISGREAMSRICIINIIGLRRKVADGRGVGATVSEVDEIVFGAGLWGWPASVSGV